jgi:hypothetical protein
MNFVHRDMTIICLIDRSPGFALACQEPAWRRPARTCVACMNTTLPIVLALLSSACFGLALVVAQFGLRHVVATAGALVAIPTMTVLLWLLCPLWLDAGGWHLGAAAIFAGRPVLSLNSSWPSRHPTSGP